MERANYTLVFGEDTFLFLGLGICSLRKWMAHCSGPRRRCRGVVVSILLIHDSSFEGLLIVVAEGEHIHRRLGFGLWSSFSRIPTYGSGRWMQRGNVRKGFGVISFGRSLRLLINLFFREKEVLRAFSAIRCITFATFARDAPLSVFMLLLRLIKWHFIQILIIEIEIFFLIHRWIGRSCQLNISFHGRGDDHIAAAYFFFNKILCGAAAFANFFSSLAIYN